MTASALPLEPPLPYLSFNDSPFQPLESQFSYFHLQTYEGLPSDSSLGVTTSPGAVVYGPGLFVDSVDGGGNNGHSLYFIGPEIIFSFDAGILGHLPTDVGIVWTDGYFNIQFTAFDQNGVSLGTIIDNRGYDFSGGGDGDPNNYRFYGAENSGGISAITISSGAAIEVDHLQYGFIASTPFTVPEPSTWVLFSLGLTGLIFGKRRKLT